MCCHGTCAGRCHCRRTRGSAQTPARGRRREVFDQGQRGTGQPGLPTRRPALARPSVRRCGLEERDEATARVPPRGGRLTVSEADEREQRTEERIQVRQVTHVQASWSELERGNEGAFTLQLILDHGVDEYVLRPTAADAQVLLQLF